MQTTTEGGASLDVAQVLHLVPVALLRHFALVLLALQVLPELQLLAGPSVAHGAVELPAGRHAHGQVTGDPLPRARVEVGTCVVLNRIRVSSVLHHLIFIPFFPCPSFA